MQQSEEKVKADELLEKTDSIVHFDDQLDSEHISPDRKKSDDRLPHVKGILKNSTSPLEERVLSEIEDEAKIPEAVEDQDQEDSVQPVEHPGLQFLRPEAAENLEEAIAAT